jgi:hypothetical protein
VTVTVVVTWASLCLFDFSEDGVAEQVTVGAVVSVVLSSTETLSEKRLATARSGFASPLRCPIATDWGLSPGAEVACGGEAAVAVVPEQDRDVVREGADDLVT